MSQTAAAEVTVRLPRPHPGQRRLAEALRHSRFVVGVLGRRAGKTLFGVEQHFRRALAAGAGYQALWAAPTYDLTTVAWDEWTRLIPSRLYEANRTEHVIRLVTGGRIYFRSTDNPDSLLGRGYDFAVLDEAGRISEDALKRAILPTLADRGGSALAITTPAGRRNWVFEWYQRGLHSERAEWAAVHAPSTDNPSPAIQAWCREMAPLSLGGGGGMPEDVYRQEILAEFLEDAAAVFRGVRAAVVPGELQSWRLARPVAIGIDVAKHQDFTVLTGVGDVEGRRQVVAWDRFHRIPWPQQEDRIVAAVREAGNPPVLLDATGVGDAVFDGLAAAGIEVFPYKFTSEGKSRLIQGLALDIEQGNLRYPEVPVLLAELEAYAYEITSQGQFRYNAPEGAHDDAVISLALANLAAKRLGAPLVSFS